ncbi:MAG: hypothetical protein AAGD11_06320 [Planctomycetota bacterium]
MTLITLPIIPVWYFLENTSQLIAMLLYWLPPEPVPMLCELASSIP